MTESENEREVEKLDHLLQLFESSSVSLSRVTAIFDELSDWMCVPVGGSDFDDELSDRVSLFDQEEWVAEYAKLYWHAIVEASSVSSGGLGRALVFRERRGGGDRQLSGLAREGRRWSRVGESL